MGKPRQGREFVLPVHHRTFKLSNETFMMKPIERAA